MNLRCPSLIALGLVALAALPAVHAAKPMSDVLPADLRRPGVERAERLARPPAPAPVPSPLGSPFSPAGFDRDIPDARDGRTESRAAAGAEKAGAAPSAPSTDRELLAAVAAKIPTTGTIILGGKPLLVSGKNRIEAGSLFTVVYNGQEYELELVTIDRTTFTIRYKGEEFTRPIKLGKSP